MLGDLKGIRNSAKFRRLRKVVGTMPYYKLTKFITYKASYYGINVVKIKECNTSKICSKCNKIGIRKYQGLFKCDNCRYEVNADYNASRNILKRALDYMPSARANGLSPKIAQETIS